MTRLEVRQKLAKAIKGMRFVFKSEWSREVIISVSKLYIWKVNNTSDICLLTNGHNLIPEYYNKIFSILDELAQK
jgi:hypothetical protein